MSKEPEDKKNGRNDLKTPYTPPDRDQILKKIDIAMNEAQRKIEKGRVYDAENEKVRIKWLKCLGYLANSYRQLKKDSDLEQIEKRLEALEKVQEDST